MLREPRKETDSLQADPGEGQTGLRVVVREDLSRVHTVDALRGLAASVVAFHHACGLFPTVFQVLRQHSSLLFDVAQFISNRNGEAVLLFFVISGFSIRLSAQRLDLTSPRDINLYVYLRLKRLLPLYWIALGLTVGLALASGRAQVETFSFSTLLGNLVFLQSPSNTRGAWFAPFGGNAPLWSLSFEVFFYGLFPAIVIMQRRVINRLDSQGLSRRYAPFFLASSMSFAALALYSLMPNPIALFVSHFLIWYLGVELAEAHLQHQQRGLSLSAPALLGSLLWLALVWITSAILTNLLIGMTIYFLWRATQILPVDRFRIVRVGTAVFCQSFGGLGRISYAIYLFHYPILQYFAAVEADTPGFALGMSVLATLGLAYVAETLSKRPTYAFLKRQYLP
jgi:peptidoglycan/LPS O-acetylase OafA/YrhL